MNDQPNMPEPPLYEPAPAPEILVDGYASSIVIAGVAKFAFFAMEMGVDGQPARRVNLRLSMPLGTLLAVQDAFGQFIANLREQGMIMDAPPKPN